MSTLHVTDPDRPWAIPDTVDDDAWQTALAELRVKEKVVTRQLDALAAERRRLPMVKMPDYLLDGDGGPVRLVDVFEGQRQLIVYNHMWFPGESWQCPGDDVYRTYNTQGRGTEQLSHAFGLLDLLPYGRQEGWQDSPDGWPQSATYSRWAPSEWYARYAD